MNEEGILTFLSRLKQKWLVAGLIVLGVVLLIIGSSSGKKKDTATVTGETVDMTVYTESLEKRIETLCEQVEGVSDVSVLLTLDGSSEYVYAENKSGGSVDYVVISVGGDEETVLVREIYASVRGIAVVCRGGDDISVQRILRELLSCALGVPRSKISVAGAGR